jgi:hypothetical protein
MMVFKNIGLLAPSLDHVLGKINVNCEINLIKNNNFKY